MAARKRASGSLELAQFANERKIFGVVGTQAIASPEVEYVRKIVAEGYVGEILSSTYIGAGLTWGNDVSRDDIYALDSKNDATLLSVIGGHAISALQSVLGRIDEVGAVLSQRRQTVRVTETGEMIPMKTPDQLWWLPCFRLAPLCRSSFAVAYHKERGSFGKSMEPRETFALLRRPNRFPQSTSHRCEWKARERARPASVN